MWRKLFIFFIAIVLCLSVFSVSVFASSSYELNLNKTDFKGFSVFADFQEFNGFFTCENEGQHDVPFRGTWENRNQSIGYPFSIRLEVSNGSYFDISDVSRSSVYFTVDYQNTTNMAFNTVYWRVKYYDSNFDYISQQIYNNEEMTNWVSPLNAKYCTFTIYLLGSFAGDWEYSFSVRCAEFYFFRSSSSGASDNSPVDIMSLPSTQKVLTNEDGSSVISYSADASYYCQNAQIYAYCDEYNIDNLYTGPTFSFDFNGLQDTLEVYFRPFPNYLDIRNINHDYSLAIHPIISYSGIPLSYSNLRISCYDANLKYIRYVSTEIITPSLLKDVAYITISIDSEFEGEGNLTDSFYVTLAGLEIEFYGNKITPVLPDGIGSIDDFDSLENGLLGNINSVISDINTFAASAIGFVQGLVGGFGFVQWLVFEISNNMAFVPSLLYISLSIGIFASIVGVVGLIVGKFGTKGGGKS